MIDSIVIKQCKYFLKGQNDLLLSFDKTCYQNMMISTAAILTQRSRKMTRRNIDPPYPMIKHLQINFCFVNLPKNCWIFYDIWVIQPDRHLKCLWENSHAWKGGVRTGTMTFPSDFLPKCCLLVETSQSVSCSHCSLTSTRCWANQTLTILSPPHFTAFALLFLLFGLPRPPFLSTLMLYASAGDGRRGPLSYWLKTVTLEKCQHV